MRLILDDCHFDDDYSDDDDDDDGDNHCHDDDSDDDDGDDYSNDGDYSYAAGWPYWDFWTTELEVRRYW